MCIRDSKIPYHKSERVSLLFYYYTYLTLKINRIFAFFYALKNAELSFGSNHLFTDVDLYINRGDKISLVGRNGCGKSTLLKVIAGEIDPDNGEIFIQPGIKTGYMPQDPDFSAYATLKEIIADGLDGEQEYKADILIDRLSIAAGQRPPSNLFPSPVSHRH